MIKTIFFDADGVIIKKHDYYSKELAKEFNISIDNINAFYKGDFLLCEAGKADLKEKFAPYLKSWGVTKSVDEILVDWFSYGNELDKKVVESIKNLRNQGMKCFVTTNNEKYRVEFFKKNLGFDSLVDGIFSSCDLGYFKKQPEFWTEVLKKLSNVKKEEVLVLDDDMKNVESAKAFGFNAEFYSDFEDYENKLIFYLNGKGTV